MFANSTNETTAGNAPYIPVPVVFQFAYLSIGTTIASLSLVTIRILWICRKLTNQIRLMSMHMTFANLLYGLTMICNFVYGNAIGIRCPVVLKVIPIAFAIYNVFLAASGLDRLPLTPLFIEIQTMAKTGGTRVFSLCLYISGASVWIYRICRWTVLLIKSQCSTIRDWYVLF